MAGLEFGFTIHATPRGGTVPAMVAANERLLAAAVEHDLSAWFIDHLQFDDQPLLECFAMLAHTMGRFPTLRAGTLVVGQNFRNPALLAKIAASLAFLSGGRFILGLGAGWKEDEYRAYGYDYPPDRERIEQLEEAAEIIRLLWGGGPATFAGKHYRIEGAYCAPPPDPAPILMLGGGGERRTLRVVARHADWWNADYYTPEDYARKLGVLRAHCAAIGRDPATIVPTYYAGVSISYDPERLIRRPPVASRPNMYVMYGTPDEVAAQVRVFADIGVRLMQLNFLDFPRTEGLELFVREVLPRFREAADGRRQAAER